MVATNLKAETVGLMDRRAAVEAEMDAIIAALSVPVGPGITGGLVDAEVGNLNPSFFFLGGGGGLPPVS